VSVREEADVELTPNEIEEIERAVDAGFKRVHGFTYKGNDVPSKHVALPHGGQNGDGSKHPPDSWQQIKRDYPDVFGASTDE
jgi:hypothetical protein